MKRIPTLLLVAFLLTGCGFFNKSAKPTLSVPVILPEIPADIRTCDGPVELNGAVTATQAVRLWAKDRRTIVECRTNHKATLGFYDALSKQLANPNAKPD